MIKFRKFYSKNVLVVQQIYKSRFNSFHVSSRLTIQRENGPLF